MLVPDLLSPEYRAVLDNYVRGAGVTVETYPTRAGNADVDGLREDVSMVYVESPNAADDGALAGAPERTAARRIDQTTAAREPRLSWQARDGSEE